MKIVVDSYAWIEIFKGSSQGEVALKHIRDAELVLTPGIVLAEISRKYLREGVKEKVILARLKTITEGSEMVQIDELMAVESSKAYMELEAKAKKDKIDKPSLFDGLVLGTARTNKASVLTGDPHFKGLPETQWIE